MLYRYHIISVLFQKMSIRNLTFSPSKKFKLFARGDMYTTDLLGIYFMFFTVRHGLLVAMFFFMFQAYLSFVSSFIQKNINYNKRLTKCILT